MRQLTCKSLLTFVVSFFLLNFSLQAQDTTKATKPQPAKASQPPKTVAPAPVRTAAPQQAKPAAAIAPTAPVDNSLSGQYEALLKHSWMQQGYKVINPSRLTTLWKSVNDSLNNNKKLLADAKRQLEQQGKELAALKSRPDAKPAKQENKGVIVNQMEVLGMSVDVSTYNWIVWGTILALALGLAGVLFSVTKNSMDSKQYKLQYEEISSEYQAFKNKAKEKEMKLARELQTERNTIEELIEKRNEEAAAKRAKK